MRYRLKHVTRFSYASPVATSRQRLHLTPRAFEHQQVRNARIYSEPAPSERTEGDDYFGNPVLDLTIRTEHRILEITSEAIVDVLPRQEFLLDLSPAWNSVAESLKHPGSDEQWDASRFCYPSPWVDVSGVHQYAQITFSDGKPLLRAAMELTERIYREFTYQGGVTDVYTPVDTVLRSRKGVCQDFAHLAIACLRAFGLPARYVSGYLLNQPATGETKLIGADASHAWLAVWCPEFGWVDFDPTNNLLTGEEHITVAWGRDYGDVAPTIGVIHGGGRQKLSVAVDVQSIRAGN